MGNVLINVFNVLEQRICVHNVFMERKDLLSKKIVLVKKIILIMEWMLIVKPVNLNVRPAKI